MPGMTNLQRDEFLSQVRYSGSISDREKAYWDSQTSFRGSVSDEKFQALAGIASGPAGQIALGKQLLAGAKANFPVLDAPSNSRAIGVNNGIVAWAGGVAGTSPTTNDPLFLPWDGTDYIYAPRNGNVVNTPNKAALQLTAGFDVRVKVYRSTVWDTTPSGGGNDVFASKQSGQLEWSFALAGTALYFYQSSDGTTWLPPIAVAAASLPLNKWIILRATCAQAGGARTIQWSVDGASWTVLTQDNGLTGPIIAGTSPVGFGSDTFGQSFDGRVAWGELRNSAGALVAKFDANLSSQTGYTDAQGNVWTITRNTSGRKTVLVERSVYLFGTDDIMVTVGVTAPWDFGTRPFSAAIAMRQWGPTASSECYFGNAVVSDPTSKGFSIWRYSGDQSINFDIYANVAFPWSGRGGASQQPYGTRQCLIGVRDPANAAGPALAYSNAATAYQTAAPVLDESYGTQLIIGSGQFLGIPADMEFFGAAIFDSTLTPEGVAAVTAALNS